MSQNGEDTAAGLVVLGMHRSGTSALAGALGLCGAWAGETEELTDPNHENPRGFWERRDIRSVCDTLLHSAEADWWKIAAFEHSAIPHSALSPQSRTFKRIVTELDTHGTWVIKEPRLCLLFSYLRAFIRNPVALLIYRNPVEVAQSLRVRNGFGLADGLALWEIYTRNALLAAHDMPCAVVSYSDLVNEPAETLAALLLQLESFGVRNLELPPTEEIEKFISRDLQHQHYEDAETSGFLLPSQQTLWDRLRSDSPLDVEIEASTPYPIRQQLRDFETRRFTLHDISAKLKRRDAAARSASETVEKLEAETARLEKRNDDRVKQAEKLEAQVAELAGRSQSLATDLDVQKAKAIAAEKQLAVSVTRTEELTASLDATRKRLKKAEDVAAIRAKELKQQTARASAAESSERELRNRIALIYASNSWKFSAPLRLVSRMARRVRHLLRNGLRLSGWLLTGQFGRAGQAILPRYRRYLPHRVRRLVPGALRRRLSKKFAAGPANDAVSNPGKVTPHSGLRDSATGNDDTLRVSHSVMRTQFGRELRRITDQKRSTGVLEELRKSDERLAAMAARMQARTERPLVSIIMPTWNRADILGNAIATALEQEYMNWELLVCDDDSSDDTAAVLEGFHDARIRYLKLPKGGAAAARNAGLANSRGSIIAYLDSDNYWHPEFLNAIVLGFLENPGRSAVYTDFIDFRVDESGKVRRARAHKPKFNHERLLEKPFIDLNSFAHKRELYDCFGGFNENLKRRQDYDLVLKYTWLRDPLHIDSLTTLYQRNEGLEQITRAQRADQSCVPIINESIDGYFRHSLPIVNKSPAKKVTIISWDLCRNHFSKPFALAEALSKDYEVQLISFRFFEEPIFPPLQGVEPDFETLYLPGGPFPDFFDSMQRALDSITGDIIYVVKPRLPSLGLALLANARSGIPIILEINDLETVVSAPGKNSSHAEAGFESTDLEKPELLNPYSDLWSELMHPLALEVPVVTTHNRAIDAVFDKRCLYMRNFKDEEVYDPEAYDRNQVRSELGFASDDRVILFGGLIRKHKGIYELVELVERLDDPRYKLLFAGSRVTPDQKKLMDRYGDRVRVLPPQDRASMARINYAADMVILWLDPDVPASRYQMPYKASDAFAMGPAVIANDISDLGILGKQGYLKLVKFGDWDAMTRTIRKLFIDEKATAVRRDASRRLFLRQFSYAAARGGFRLAAERALAAPSGVLPVARTFAERFNRFYQVATGSGERLVVPDDDERALDGISDSVPDFGTRPEDQSIVIVDSTKLPADCAEGHADVTVVMPSLDPEKAVATARILARRAGMATTIIVAVDTARLGFIRTLNAVTASLDSAYVVYLAEDALPGIDWLKRAFETLERTGKGLLAFNDGKWHGRIAGFGMVRTSWVRQVYDRAILFPGYHSHKADNELTVIARLSDQLVYEATATLVEIDPGKALVGGETNPDSRPSHDRQLFYERFHSSFDSRFHWQDVVALKDTYLNLRKLRDLQAQCRAPSEDPVTAIDAAEIDALQADQQLEVAVILPCIDTDAARETVRLLSARAGMPAAYFVVNDRLRQGFISTLNATASKLTSTYIVYLAEDAFPGTDWLRIAYEQLEHSGKGLLAFNCGKWHGRVAAFGMVRCDWARRVYGPGVILNPEYKAHKADNELTVIARVQDEFLYTPDSVLIENDREKVFTETEPADKETFHRRFASGFGGLLRIEDLRPLANSYFVPLPEASPGESAAEPRIYEVRSATQETPPESEQATSKKLGTLREPVLDAEKAAPAGPALSQLLSTLKASAEQALSRGTHSVIDKTTLPPSGDRRDYWHPAPYWWPAPGKPDGLPYVRKDGQRVPGSGLYENGSEQFDRSRLQRVFDDSFVLALAHYFLDDARYAEAGARILQRFFLDAETGMHPHLEYAQVRLGHNGDRGAPSGLIESKDMYFYLDAVRLLIRSKALPAEAESMFRTWLGRFLDWLMNSTQGKEERLALNNHGTCYDLQVCAIATFLDEKQVVYDTLERAQARIATQFSSTGEQPQELARQNPLHYCCFNLQSWVNLAELALRWDLDLWNCRASSGASLAAAASWLLATSRARLPQADSPAFDDDRLAPVRIATAERCAAGNRSTAGEPDVHLLKPVFHPHDGIRPFWNLGSYSTLEARRRTGGASAGETTSAVAL